MLDAVVLEEKWLVLGRDDTAAGWLRIWTDLGRAPRTIDAYARGLAESLEVCEREGVDPVAANRAHIAVFVRELTSRPSCRGANVVSIECGAGLSNATIQHRLVPIRLFYDHLIEEGLRESNPVGRGKYTPGRRFGGLERVVLYSAPAGVLLSDYLAHRAMISRARRPLFLSESRRSYGQPVTLRTWSKVVRRIAVNYPVPRFSTHTTRHLCLTDLARMGWELHAIATFAGHRSTESILAYIHLSGRDLADKLNRRMLHIHGWRVEMLAGDQRAGRAEGDRYLACGAPPTAHSVRWHGQYRWPPGRSRSA